MNILEVTTFLRGGAGVLTTQLACEFIRRGHQVAVISSGSIDELNDWEELVNRLSLFRVKHYTVNTFKREGEFFWISVHRMTEIIKNHQFDVIHAQAGVPALIVKMAQDILETNIPVLATFHSWNPFRPDWMNVADTASFNYCDLVAYNSTYYEQLGKQHGIKRQSQVVYPFVVDESKLYDTSYTQSIFEQYNIPQNSIVISNLAEITERKGQLQLVKALSEVHKSHSNCHLLLIGEGKNKKYLGQIMNCIEELGLKGFVHFTGWVNNPYHMLAQSHLFVFPSYSEGLGMAIIESILLEKPTVFSHLEGMIDIAHQLADDGFGTFNPAQVDEIVTCINQVLVMSEEERLGKVNRSKVRLEKIYSLVQMSNQYETLLKQIVNK